MLSPTRGAELISLADEENVKQVLVNSVLGIWDVVNNRLGMAVTSVYKAKSNIQKLLETEVRHLEGISL